MKAIALFFSQNDLLALIKTVFRQKINLAAKVMCFTLNKDVAGLKSAELCEVSQKPLITALGTFVGIF